MAGLLKVALDRLRLIPRVKRLFTREVFTQNCILLRTSVTMSRIAELLRSRRMPQVTVLTLMSVGFAGCSADMQTRFSDSSFSNPFASQPEATGSVRTPAVERHELPQYSRPPQIQSPQYQSQDLPPPAVAAR